MEPVLIINRHTIKNYTDYKRVFSPWGVYDRLSDFILFAPIHLVPLPTLYSAVAEDGSQTLKRAEYFTKDFWMNLLLCASDEQFDAKSLNPEAVLEERVQQAVHKREQSVRKTCAARGLSEEATLEKVKKEVSEEKKMIEPEMNGVQLDKKVEHIRASACLGDSPEDDRTALILLAITELSDEDVLQYDFNRPGEEANNDEQLAEELSESSELCLTARITPYKLKKFTEESLPAGKCIRVICIRIIPSNDSNSAAIALCEDDKAVYTELIPAEGYRFATAVDNRIIKLLPTISINTGKCVYRKSVREDNLVFLSDENYEREQTLPEGTVVSSLSAGNGENYYAYISNGQCRFSRKYEYSLSNTDRTKLKYRVKGKDVEVCITENNRYVILREDGTIESNDPSLDRKKGVLTLDKINITC